MVPVLTNLSFPMIIGSIICSTIKTSLLSNSSMFKGNVQKNYRSLMNVTFSTGSKELDDKFVKDAAKNGLVSLAGHKTAGGMRASIYNAMPVEGVKALVEFMKKFESENR